MPAKLLVAVCLLIFSSAAVHSQTGRPSSLATVSGRITAQGKGVPDALVLIWKQPVLEPYDESTLRGVTDSQGKYQIKNVPPGNYYASANAPGYFFVEDGKPSLQLKPLVVVEGDALNNVDFQLLKGGVITGKVVSPDDKPIPEIPVTVIPEIPQRQARGPGQAMKRPNSTRTDDRGIYRIYGITPGKYRVAAGDAITAYATNRGAIGVVRTFFPNTTDEIKASVLTVGSGQVMTGVDIKTGPPEPWFSISGRVVDAVSGTPVPNISCGVEIYGTETTESMKGSISGLNFSNSRGEFNVDGLTPGRYRISAPSNLVVAGSPPPEQFGSSDDIEIVDRDLNGIVVKVSKSAAISGVIRIEGTTDAAALEKLRRLRLNAFTIPEPGKIISAQPLVINSDNTFSVRGLKPGRLSISLNPGGVGEDVLFQVSRIETAGVVATEDIELKSGDELSDVTVVMTYANSRIHGTVKLSNDQSIGKVSGNVFLYLDAKVIAYGMIDARGEFLIQDVPAGNFRLVADIQVPGSKPLRSEQFVTVTAGKTAEVTLTALSQN